MPDALAEAILGADDVAVVEALHAGARRVPEVEFADWWRKQEEQERALRLAVVGLADFETIRAQGRMLNDQLAVELMLHRDPPWLVEWAKWMGTDSPAIMRLLVRLGVRRRPPDYLEQLVRFLDAPRLLANDPELLQREVWDILGGDYDLRTAEDAGRNWRAALIEHVDDRARLLDAVLQGLARDLNAYAASWYTKLWKELKVTREERAARPDALRALLGASAAPVVGFAVAELLRTDASVLPGELAPALAAKTKTTVRGALKLLDRDPDADVALIALGHEDAAIQGEVLGRLETWGAPDALRNQLDALAATQRLRAGALLGTPNLKVPGTFISVDVDHIPEAIRAALNFGGPAPLAPVEGEPTRHDPVAPITSIDELADALATALAHDTDDERLLDAVLRGCDQPFPAELHAFKRRLRQRGFEYSLYPARAARAWLLREVPELDEPAVELWVRVREACARVARGEARPLLSLPTHEGGWIDPHVLAERLHDDPDPNDFAQALLRLMPGDPEVANGVPGRSGELLRCALGGDPVDGEGPVEDAARAARDPFVLPDPETLSRGPLRRFLRRESDDPALWPARHDLACEHALGYMRSHATGTSEWPGTEPLVALRTEPLSPPALRLVTLALGSSHPDEHLLAADIVIAGVEDGRIDRLPTDDIGDMKTNRLTPRLVAIAEAGPLPRAVVRQFLEAGLPDVKARPGPLRTLLDELRANPTADEAQLALAARVRRAERWIEAQRSIG
ncbi:DUF6493 family protein [Solirubrobacter taibaiensis]|nr:DUF6493 family protein [Solirubrobacter taibaiensis]